MPQKRTFRLASWEEGRKFMKNVATAFATQIEERDADELILHENFKLTMHPDDRGFAFIMLKIVNDDTIPELDKIIASFIE